MLGQQHCTRHKWGHENTLRKRCNPPNPSKKVWLGRPLPGLSITLASQPLHGQRLVQQLGLLLRVHLGVPGGGGGRGGPPGVGDLVWLRALERLQARLQPRRDVEVRALVQRLLLAPADQCRRLLQSQSNFKSASEAPCPGARKHSVH